VGEGYRDVSSPLGTPTYSIFDHDPARRDVSSLFSVDFSPFYGRRCEGKSSPRERGMGKRSVPIGVLGKRSAPTL